MARTIYINTDNGSIESAPVAGLNRPSARVPLREIVAGTTETYNLYLVKSDGTYDSRSGSGAVSVNVAIGQRGQTATSGNFTITDSAATTSAEISATASAQAVEDVLNAMNSGAGIASNTVYLSTNGTTDKAINADCSAAGESTYKITGKIRSSTTGMKYCEVSGELLEYNLTVSDEWIDFETNTSSSIIPDEVIVGYALFGQPPFEVERFSEADWFDVRLINTITGETVAYWPLNEKSSGSLNGVTATDSVGGYDGTHIGCTGGSEYIAGVLNASLIDVQKLGSGIWLATWRENGARTVLTGASVDLTPESVVVPSISVTGDASSKCQQLIEVNRQPAIFQDTWSPITNGFSGTLDADAGRIVQAMSDGQSIDFYFEVRIDDDAICSTPIRVLAPVGGAASVSSAAPYGGTLASDPANYPGFSVSAWESALSIEGFSAITPDDEAIIRGNGTEWVKASNFRVDAGTDNSGTEMGTGTADGSYAVAEGSSTTASGSFSHAEGFYTIASGVASHAEGSSTIASGLASHAEGSSTIASGNYSSATGRRGKAIHDGARVEADSQDADVSSTATDQFTARFQNGYEFKGGLAAFEGGASFGDATTQATTRANLGVMVPLGVADPTSGAGVAADVHTEGYTNETPPRYFKKVGAGDTAWEQNQVGSVEVDQFNFPNLTTSELDAVSDAEAGDTYFDSDRGQFVRFTGAASYDVVTSRSFIKDDLLAATSATSLQSARFFESGLVAESDPFLPNPQLTILDEVEFSDTSGNTYIYCDGASGSTAGWVNTSNPFGSEETGNLVVPGKRYRIVDGAASVLFSFNQLVASDTADKDLFSVALQGGSDYKIEVVAPICDLAEGNLRFDVDYTGLYTDATVHLVCDDLRGKNRVVNFKYKMAETDFYSFSSNAAISVDSPKLAIYTFTFIIRPSSDGTFTLSARQDASNSNPLLIDKAQSTINGLSD